MANRYWVGGIGNWDATTTHWSATSGGAGGASVPTSADNVIFDSASFTAEGQIVTIGAIANCLDITWTGVKFTPTLTGASYVLNIYGSLTLIPEMICSFSGGINLVSTSFGRTITSAGQPLKTITFNSTTGGWTLLDDLTTSNTVFMVKAGTFNSNDKDITCSVFNTDGTLVRTLSLGASVIRCGSVSISSITGLSFLADSAQWIMTGGGTFNSTYALFNNIEFASGVTTVHTSNTFTNFVIDAGVTVQLVYGTTMTVVNMTTNSTPTTRATLKSNSAGTPAYLYKATSGTIDISNLIIQDINANNSNAMFLFRNSKNVSGNSGYMQFFKYWVGGTGSWTQTAHWSLTSGGVGGEPIPTATGLDNVYFDENSFTSDDQVVTVNSVAYCRDIDWTGALYSPDLTGTSQLNIYGSATFNPSMTCNVLYLSFNSLNNLNKTITSSGIVLNGNLSFDTVNANWYLQDDLSIGNYTLYVNTGSFYSNSHNITCGAFNSNNANSRYIGLGSSVINCANIDFTVNTNFSNSMTSATFILTGIGALAIGTNSLSFGTIEFNGLTVVSTATSTLIMNTMTLDPNAIIKLPSATTSNVYVKDVVSNATLESRATIQSVTPGSPANLVLYKPNTTIDTSNLIVQDIKFSSAFDATSMFLFRDSKNISGNTGIVQFFKYWVGGSGNTNDSVHWSSYSGGPGGEPLPTLIDNILFDANSFTATGQTVTVNSILTCRDINWTGVSYNPTFTGGNAININGNIVLDPGFVSTIIGYLSIVSPTNPCKITGNGFVGNLYIQTVIAGCSVILQDDLNIGTGIFSHQYGTLNTNDKTLTCGGLYSNGATIRTLTLGSSIINCNTVLFSVTSFTYTPNTAKFVMNGNGSFQGLSVTYNSIEFNGITAVYGNNTFNNFILNAGSVVQLSSGISTTVINLVSNGTIESRATLKSVSIGATAYFIKSTNTDISNLIIQDIAFTGNFIFRSSRNVSGNSGAIQFFKYWVGGSGTWSDINHWSLTSGGSGGESVPTTQYDNILFDANSFTATGQTVNMNNAITCRDISYLDVLYTPSFSGAGYPNVYGDMVFSPDMTYSSTNYTMIKGASSKITSNGLVMVNSIQTNAGCSLILQDDLNLGTGTFNHQYGVLNTNNKTLTCAGFYSNSTNSRTLTLGSSIVKCASVYFNGSGLTYTANTAQWVMEGTGVFDGVSLSHASIEFNGITTLPKACSFTNIILDVGCVVNLPVSTTITTTNMVSNATAAAKATLQSATTGTIAYLTKSSGSFDVNHIIARDIAATSGSFFRKSQNLGNNTGITFDSHYWVEGTGNWSDVSHWAYTSGAVGGSEGAQVPNKFENVVFDVNSFTNDGQVVTADIDTIFQDMKWTDATHNPTFNSSKVLTINGSITLIPNMMWIQTGAIVFSSLGTYNITSAGNVLTTSDLNIQTSGCNIVLLDDLIIGNYINHQYGTLNLNGFTITCNYYYAPWGNTHGLIFGTTGKFICVSAYIVSTGLTYASNTGSFVMVGNGTFTGSSLAYLSIEIQGTTIISGSTTFANFIVGPNSVTKLTNGSIQYITNLVSNATPLNRATIQSANPGTSATIQKSIAGSVSNLTVKDIYSNSSMITCKNSQNVSGNTGSISFPDRIWVNGTGFWNDTNHWSTYDGGPGGASVPTATDPVYFTAYSFTAFNQVITINATANCLDMDWTGVLNIPTLDGTYALNVYGNLILNPYMNIPYSGLFSLKSTSPQSITTNGLVLNNLNFNSTAACTLQDDLSVATTLSLVTGTLNTNNKTISCNTFDSNYSSTRALTLGSSVINVSSNFNIQTSTGLSLTCGTSIINMAGSNVQFNGGSLTYSTLNSNGSVVLITGSNTFNTLIINADMATKLTSGTTQTVTSFISTGIAGHLSILQSSVAGTPATIRKISGSVDTSFVSVQDIKITGTLNYFLVRNSVDVSGNTGVQFDFNSPILNIAISNIGPGDGTLTWSQYGEATGYNVYDSDDKLIAIMYGIDSTTSRIANLLANGSYTFKLSAFNETQESSKNLVSLNTPAIVIPNTWSPVDKGTQVVLSNNNLTMTATGGWVNGGIRGLYGVSSGKFYWEVKNISGVPTAGAAIGIGNSLALLTSFDTTTNSRTYLANGKKYPENIAYGVSYAANSIIGIALDMDAGTLIFYKDGVSQGVSHTNVKTMGVVYPYITSSTSTGVNSATINFGATAFTYPIPEGYSAYIQATTSTANVRSNPLTMDVGDYLSCRYTATSNTVGQFTELGMAQGTLIPPSSAVAPDGYFNFIYVGDDEQGHRVLVADRCVQNTIAWDTLNLSSITTGNGMPYVTYGNNLCASGTAIENNHYSGQVAALAFDGSISSAWYSLETSNQSGVSWIGYDFGMGNPKAIRQMRLYTYSSTSCNLSSVKIQSSNDNVIWDTVSVNTISTTVNTWVTMNLQDSPSARYWRILANANSADRWTVREVQMFASSLLPNTNYSIRLLTGPTTALDTDNEYDKYIVNSDLNGTITAGDNNIWNWAKLYTKTSTTDSPNGSSYRVLMGWDTIRQRSYVTSPSAVATDGFRPVLVVDIPQNKYLFQDGAFIKSFINSSWQTVGNVPVTPYMFLTYGITSLQAITDPILRQLAAPKLLIQSDSASTRLDIMAAPVPKVVLSNIDISLSDVNNIYNFALATTLIGNGTIRLLVSGSSGITWKGYVDNAWIPIDTSNLADVKSKGISLITLASIPSADWNDLTSLSHKIRFGYYLEQLSSYDVVKINAITGLLDIVGLWSNAVVGIDYNYNYPQNDILRMVLSTSGTYKITMSDVYGGNSVTADAINVYLATIANVQGINDMMAQELAMTNFKLDSYTNASKNSMKNLIIDCFNDTTGLDLINTTATFDSSAKSMKLGIVQSNNDMTSSIPTAILLTVDETLDAGSITYQVSRDGGLSWVVILPQVKTAITSGSGLSIIVKANITGDAQLNAWAYSWS